MPQTFSSPFTHYLIPSEETVRTALTAGMVVFDTNVLLSAYRFAPQAREELLSAMERLRDRVWVPHQVGLEFHRRRLDVIADQRAAYETVLDLIAKHRADLNREIGDAIRQLSNRAALTDSDKSTLLQQLENALEPLEGIVRRLNEDHKAVGIHEEDPILLRLQSIIGENIGEEFTEEPHRDALQEAERRKKAKIPPGFKDADKTESHGDYFVWRQALEEAKRRSVHDLLFVTSDQKEDWYLKVKGKHLGHPQLTQEVRDFCNAQLVMMNTQTLLHHARQYLDVNVSNETIRQAGVLREVESGREELDVLMANADDLDAHTQAAAARTANIRRSLDTVNAFRRTVKDDFDDSSPTQANRQHEFLNKLDRDAQQLTMQLKQSQDEEILARSANKAVLQRIDQIRQRLNEDIQQQQSLASS